MTVASTHAPPSRGHAKTHGTAVPIHSVVSRPARRPPHQSARSSHPQRPSPRRSNVGNAHIAGRGLDRAELTGRRAESGRRRRVGLSLAAAAAVCLAACALAASSATLVGSSSSGLRSSSRVAAAAATAAGDAAAAATARVAVVAPLAATSLLGRPGRQPSWGEVLEHTAHKMAWHNATYSLTVLDAAQPAVELEAALKTASPQIVVVIGVADGSPAAAALPALLAAAPTVVVLDSGAALRAAATRLGGRVALAPKGPLERLLDLLPWSAARHDAQVLASVEELFSRRNSEDLLFAMLVLVNEHVAEVPAVANSAKSQNAGLDAVKCMLGKCGGEIFACYADASCRAALDCLNTCKFNDQVCSYRCIASYESPPLAAFSLCILQKHNCLGLTASPPAVPDPALADAHGGRPMTHELAEDLFVGWLEGAAAASQALSPDAQARTGPFSWRVFGGKNPAYDYFPCQFQLFYRGQAKNSMWYDPIFKVKTLDGREVWRQRHYRVRRGKVPGTFHLSVLDNGVTSLEFWRILDCHERLEWCVFYYTGAAAAAGASYAGAILGSPSGARPTGAADLGRIAAALERAGIKMWELSNVDNSNCVGAPLVPAAAFG